MRGLRIYALLLSGILTCLAASLRAEELEYKMEMGGMLGANCYFGDARYSGSFKYIRPMGGAVVRYNLNPRMAVKGNLVAAGIAGSTAGNDYRIPEGDISFSRLLFDLGAQFEYNFLAYGTGGGYKRTHRLVPYIFAGAGMVYAPAPAKHIFTANIPLGVGVKFKFARRFNVGCELSFRFSFSDKLDVDKQQNVTLDDPHKIDSKFFKNKDSYSFLSVFLTYDLFPKYRKCNN